MRKRLDALARTMLDLMMSWAQRHDAIMPPPDATTLNPSRDVVHSRLPAADKAWQFRNAGHVPLF